MAPSKTRSRFAGCGGGNRHIGFAHRTHYNIAAGLEWAIPWIDRHPQKTTAERIVLLFAWNEYGEGGYLAPTQEVLQGAYLKAAKQVVHAGGD